MQNINITKQKYLEQYDFPFCGNVNKFEKLAKIGQGTFGEVFKARNRNDPQQIVALKKIFMVNEKQGFPITALREIRILSVLKHQNIVNLFDICYNQVTELNNRSEFYLVFEFCEHDLAGLLSNTSIQFELGEIKEIIKQMLDGLHYLHTNMIIHRDMKSANILMTKTGILKIADFGLARAISAPLRDTQNRYTNRVVTLWYRPPELLLGERNYGSAVDMWGIGCIIAELWTRCPILQGNSEQKQLILISQLCGSITPEVWPKVVDLDLYTKLDLIKKQKRKVKDKLKTYIQDVWACDLIDKLLILDPDKRINAITALDHEFFWRDPMPCNLSKMVSKLKDYNFEYTIHTSKRLQNNLQSSSAVQSSSSVVIQDTSTTSGFQDHIF